MTVLGDSRGYVHYQGQPKLYQDSGEHGLQVETYTKVFCGKCRETGQTFEECPIGKKMQSDLNHSLRDCPKAVRILVR